MNISYLEDDFCECVQWIKIWLWWGIRWSMPKTEPPLNLKITYGQWEPKSVFGTSAPGTFWPELKADIRAVKTRIDDSFLVKRWGQRCDYLKAYTFVIDNKINMTLHFKILEYWNSELIMKLWGDCLYNWEETFYTVRGARYIGTHYSNLFYRVKIQMQTFR